MAYPVIMPKQGLQMTEGTVLEWFAQEGDSVTEGTPLFSMETDKVTIDIDAPASGTLLKIVREVGETVPITHLLAVIGEPGEDITAIMADADQEAGAETTGSAEKAAPEEPVSEAPAPIHAPTAERGRVFSTPRARMRCEERHLDIAAIPGTGPDGLVIERDVMQYAGQAPAPRATPLAKKVAEIHGVTWQEVAGTGVRGKITRADVEALVAERKARQHRPGADRLLPFAGMRKVIADRMTQSLHDMAQANHKMKVDMTEVLRFRDKLKADDMKVSLTDIFVRVVARALRDYPIINSTLTAEGILLKDAVNMGLAVAVENGLIVPVVKDAHLLTLEEISVLSADLISRAQQGQLTPDEYSGGTFTISNLGMYDIDEFTAIINPPESAILAIGKIDRIPVAEGDAVVIKPIMVLSLTYDHRIIDGAPAAQFLQRVKQIMQNPYMLI